MKSNFKKLNALLIVLASLILVACVVDEAKLEEGKIDDVKNVSEMLCETQNGDSLKLGDSAPSDDCNACVCGEGGEIACDTAVCKKSSQAVCEDGNGNLVKAGESFKLDCNTCFCDQDGNAACTEMACVDKPETICHDCDASYLNVGCQGDDSVTVGPGDSLILDGLPCVCAQNGILTCSVTILKETGEGCYSFIDSLSQSEYEMLTEEESLETKGYKVDNVYCELEEPRFCTTEYDPVCAKTQEGKIVTFGNSCEATAQKAELVYKGECK